MGQLRAFKYRLVPTGPQAAEFRHTLGACRFVWNRTLAEQQRRFEAKEKRLSFPDACRELAIWRQSPETPWLASAPSAAQQQALKDLERAYQNLFAKRARRPRFRRRGDDSAFRFAAGFAVDIVNGRVKVPKLGWVRFRNHRRLEGKPKQMTISSRAGRWYVSIQVELDVPEPQHPAPSAAVGVDAGVVHFATLSTGEHLAPVAAFKKHEKRLAWQQRKLARKQKGSNNFAKQKRVVQRAHVRMADARADFLHKASHRLTRDFGVVAIEDLDVKSMTRSARGTVAAPGRNVRAKSGLNKALLNHGLGEFRRQLEYKAAWRGGVVIAVPPHHTSQTCPVCGVVDAASRQSQAEFRCVACGHAANADVVAARNILARAVEVGRAAA
ncbi:MAG: transposase [Archangium sp.]|nr:transposase [Archangium sp.]